MSRDAGRSFEEPWELQTCWFSNVWHGCKGVSGEAYIDIQNKSGPWPSKYIMTRVCMLQMLSVVVVQSLSHVWLFANPRTAARQASLSFTISWSLLKFMSMKLVMPSNHLILFSPSPALNLSQCQGLFQWVSCSHQVAKVLKLQVQHQSLQWIFGVNFL